MRACPASVIHSVTQLLGKIEARDLWVLPTWLRARSQAAAGQRQAHVGHLPKQRGDGGIGQSALLGNRWSHLAGHESPLSMPGENRSV